jgi:hypothetical protein
MVANTFKLTVMGLYLSDSLRTVQFGVVEDWFGNSAVAIERNGIGRIYCAAAQSDQDQG